jgi:hypothetical protein
MCYTRNCCHSLLHFYIILYDLRNTVGTSCSTFINDSCSLLRSGSLHLMRCVLHDSTSKTCATRVDQCENAFAHCIFLPASLRQSHIRLDSWGGCSPKIYSSQGARPTRVLRRTRFLVVAAKLAAKPACKIASHNEELTLAA